MGDEKTNKPARSNLSRRILIGLILGVLTGLFLGEYAGNLAIIGQGYVALLQMSILPYMTVSLIGGIGQLSYEKAGNLALTAGAVLIVSWVLAFFVVFVMPLAFPESLGGSFYSPSLVQAADVDFIDLYIPKNPFSSLARTVVPAVAVFSVLTGVALIGVKNKKPLLDLMGSVGETLQRVAMMIVQITPIGVFAIAANAAGTLTVEEFGRLQTYILTFIMATLVLTFWVLPALVAAVTPFTYRDVMRSARDALVTGFVTGNLFIVLPMLVENGKRLFEERRLASQDSASYVEVLVPTSFNFPNIGKLLTLLFILFAGWYTGRQLDLGDYPMFSVMGLFTLFGGVDLALPFLLDQLRIPSDMYQLYVVTGVVNGWFATLLAVMNLFTFTLIATAAAVGTLKIDWPRLSRFAIISLVVLALAILGTRIGLSFLVGEEDVSRQTLMHAEIPDPVPMTVREQAPELKDPMDMSKPRLQQIIDRKTLRIGYHPGGLPFVFFNDAGKLVGYDVELYNILARDLGVELEFIPWKYDTLVDQLKRGEFDLVAGGLILTVERLAHAAFSGPYMEITTALVVPDYKRNAYPTWDAVEASGIRIGITGEARARKIGMLLVNNDIVEVASYGNFFGEGRGDLDAIMISAEAGSAWTVLHPDYAVAIPKPHYSQPIAVALARGDQQIIDYLDDWLKVKKTDGTLDELYDKWILGKSEAKKQPRWSIIRDVLGWVQ
jgi:Na+/H+-dicarboxylate symporter/ABC-type amino acid transport substrate-binding protein